MKDPSIGFYLIRQPNDSKCVNKEVTLGEGKSQKEECDNELWKVAFHCISQNI